MRPRRSDEKTNRSAGTSSRLFVVKLFLIAAGLIIVGRLFYVQVIRQDYYKDLARGEQFKELEIEPERGDIYMMSGSNDPVALVLNESRYTIFVDPVYVKDKDSTATELAATLNLEKESVKSKLDSSARYVIIAKKVTKDKKAEVENKKLKGVAWKEERIRVYPQGTLASHTLGFVNDDALGQYGVEGALDSRLKGVPGTIRAVTDREGTPLVQNKDNIVQQPQDGETITLTLDQTIQRIAEEEIKTGVERSGATSGSVIVMETKTGYIKAMANYPTYDPAAYQEVTDQNAFKNQAVSDPLEPGSIVKTLLVGAAIDKGVVGKDSTYYDSGIETIDGTVVKNLTPLTPGPRSMFDILQYSLNTGAIHLVKEFGAGQLNEQARTTWYDYLSQRYHFTDKASVELEEAVSGYIPSPTEGDGLRVQYANMAFGQGMTMTIQQFASALSGALNGGTYYKPTVIYSSEQNGQVTIQEPQPVPGSVISQGASRALFELMNEYENKRLPSAVREGFVLGGKTGTAQVPGPDGKYREDIFNATFAGFLGRRTAQYVIVVRLNEGKANENFSGFEDARPVYLGIVNGMMDNVPFTE